MFWRFHGIRIRVRDLLAPLRTLRTPHAVRGPAASRSQEHARALFRPSASASGTDRAGATTASRAQIDQDPTGKMVFQEGDAASTAFAPPLVSTIEPQVDSGKASLGLDLLNAFEQAGDSIDTVDAQLIAKALKRWPGTVGRLTRRSSAVMPATPPVVQAERLPQPVATRPSAPAVSSPRNDWLASSVTSAYESALKRACKPDERPLSSQEKREYMQRRLGTGIAVKFCSPGDWVAIASDAECSGHYVIPNPFTANMTPVEKLTKFYPAMESDATRSHYKLMTPTWVGAPVLENARFDIDEIDQTWTANGVIGEVTKID